MPSKSALKKLIIGLIIVGAIWIVACSNKNPETNISSDSSVSQLPRNVVDVTAEVEASEGPVMLFTSESSFESPIIKLELFGKPFPLGGKRFIKLTGLVGTINRRALIEISGVGRVVSVGDAIEEFQVVEISREVVSLRRI